MPAESDAIKDGGGRGWGGMETEKRGGGTRCENSCDWEGENGDRGRRVKQ